MFDQWTRCRSGLRFTSDTRRGRGGGVEGGRVVSVDNSGAQGGEKSDGRWGEEDPRDVSFEVTGGSPLLPAPTVDPVSVQFPGHGRVTRGSGSV